MDAPTAFWRSSDAKYPILTNLVRTFSSLTARAKGAIATKNSDWTVFANWSLRP